jgi:hypothetical protein
VLSYQDAFDRGQTQQCVSRRENVIEHHAQAAMPGLIKVAYRLRFDDVEKAE